MSQTVQSDFEVMPMPRKGAPQLYGGSYKVYKSPKDYVLVTADSALDALQQSGLETAYKIERESMDNISVLSAASWKAREVSLKPAALPANEPTDTVLLQVQEQKEEKASESPETLSNDDVEKLLKN